MAKLRQFPPGHKGDVCFEVGDAMNIPDSWSNFDLVHAANLICRLPSPQKFLDRIPGMVKQGGQLLLATLSLGWKSIRQETSGWVLEILEKRFKRF